MYTTKYPTFEFSQLNDNQYKIVNDGVMGGRSDSEITVMGEVVRFQGRVSLQNNGGFASVRMIWPFAVNTAYAEPSIAKLKVMGDGQIYQFRLRTNRGFDGAAYSYSFKTLKDQVQTVYIPLDQFVPSFRGRILTNMPSLKFSDVQQMGILVADSQVGEFGIDLIAINLH
jgi:hypothetical protein